MLSTNSCESVEQKTDVPIESAAGVATTSLRVLSRDGAGPQVPIWLGLNFGHDMKDFSTTQLPKW